MFYVHAKEALEILIFAVDVKSTLTSYFGGAYNYKIIE